MVYICITVSLAMLAGTVVCALCCCKRPDLTAQTGVEAHGLCCLQTVQHNSCCCSAAVVSRMSMLQSVLMRHGRGCCRHGSRCCLRLVAARAVLAAVGLRGLLLGCLRCLQVPHIAGHTHAQLLHLPIGLLGCRKV